MIFTLLLVEVPLGACAASAGGLLKINSSSSLLVDCGVSALIFRSHAQNDATATYERLCACHGWCTQSGHCRSAEDTDATPSSSATPGAAVE